MSDNTSGNMAAIWQRHKWWIIGCGAALILVITVVVVTLSRKANLDEQVNDDTSSENVAGNNTASSGNGGTGEEGENPDDVNHGTWEDTPGRAKVVFYDSVFVSNFINNANGSSMAIDIIDEALVSFIPNASGTYSTTAAGKSVDRGISFPYDVLAFTLQLSDDSAYDVHIAKKNSDYYGMTVSNGAVAKFYLVYLRSPEEAGFDTNVELESLTRWAQRSNPEATITQPTIYASY